MKKTLVILAAGMGSRYGGLKQVDTLGSNGESIIDFTIYDAIKAGFEKLVLIIRKEHEEIFEANIAGKVRPFIEVAYAYQDLKDLPEGVNIPADRVKPWGTTHALLSCRNILKDDSFIVCNADDFYGLDSFKKVAAFFDDTKANDEYCMVGYKIENTLSDNGTVTRGVCQKDENGYLTKIQETMDIKYNDDKTAIVSSSGNLPIGTPVSMNFWGFKPSVIEKLGEIFKSEINEGIKANPLKYEALLPNHIGQLVKENKAKVKVLTSEDSWFGVTYKEDKPSVVAKIQIFKDQGLYPFDLWKKQ